LEELSSPENIPSLLNISVYIKIRWLPFAMLQHLCDSCGAQRSLPFPTDAYYGPLGSSCVHSYTSSSSRDASTTISNRQTQVHVSFLFFFTNGGDAELKDNKLLSYEHSCIVPTWSLELIKLVEVRNSFVKVTGTFSTFYSFSLYKTEKIIIILVVKMVSLYEMVLNATNIYGFCWLHYRFFGCIFLNIKNIEVIKLLQESLGFQTALVNSYLMFVTI
jgi:hypothetical protein